MLLIFGIAMGLMGLILVPTFNDVGPTAPVDEDWHESTGDPERHRAPAGMGRPDTAAALAAEPPTQCPVHWY